MIAALAGRRIDAEDSEETQFPLDMIDTVYEEIYKFLRKRKITTLISSAACGADLLAQKAAGELGIDRHIVLPFNRRKFLKTSVNDRPGNWEKLFNKVCDEAKDRGNFVVLKGHKDEESAYSAVTEEFFNQLQKLKSSNEKIITIAVWEGNARDEGDETVSFIKKANFLKYEVKEILTVP